MQGLKPFSRHNKWLTCCSNKATFPRVTEMSSGWMSSVTSVVTSSIMTSSIGNAGLGGAETEEQRPHSQPAMPSSAFPDPIILDKSYPVSLSYSPSNLLPSRDSSQPPSRILHLPLIPTSFPCYLSNWPSSIPVLSVPSLCPPISPLCLCLFPKYLSSSFPVLISLEPNSSPCNP